MNFITIAGQLGNDSEVKFLPDGTAVCSFSVADSQGQDKPTIWHRCQLFGKRAESKLPNYLVKGAHVTVVGELTQREYVDKDGNKKNAQEIRVQNVALQGGKQNTAQESAPQPQQQARPQAAPAPRPAPQPAPNPNIPDFNDDVPF